MRSRGNYWSCSKFARWCQQAVGAVPKLDFGTSKEWKDWESQYKTQHPHMHWFTETALGKIQKFVSLPQDILYDIRVYLYNRFVTKTHYAQTYLKKGQWHESDTRILHGMFGVLVDYVESECVSHNLACSNKDDPIRKEVPWHRRTRWFNWFEHRSPKLGLDYLDWEISLGKGSPRQAESAQQIKDLYVWWTVTRPARVDPYEAAKFNDVFNPEDGLDWVDISVSEEMQAKRVDVCNLVTAIEEQYDAEDTVMLIKLINIRHSLWT